MHTLSCRQIPIARVGRYEKYATQKNQIHDIFRKPSFDLHNVNALHNIKLSVFLALESMSMHFTAKATNPAALHVIAKHDCKITYHVSKSSIHKLMQTLHYERKYLTRIKSIRYAMPILSSPSIPRKMACEPSTSNSAHCNQSKLS